MDFLKFDFCYRPPATNGPTPYRRMAQALRSTGREVLFSALEWGLNEPWLWARQAGCQMWRTTGDVADKWASVEDIGFRQATFIQHSGPGGWNDPDMLVVGMRGEGNVAEGDCTDAEYELRIALWCLMPALLMLGCDVRAMDDTTRRLVTHPGLIAINQDAAGLPCRCLNGDESHWDGQDFQVWARSLADGSVAVGFFNLHDERTGKMVVGWESLHLDLRRRCRVVDVLDDEDLGVFDRSFGMNLSPHHAKILRLHPLPL